MPTHGSLTKAGKVRGQTPKVEGRKRVGTSASLRNKSNLRNDLSFLEFLVKTNLDEEEGDVGNHQFSTNFSLLDKTNKRTNLSMGTVLYGIWKI